MPKSKASRVGNRNRPKPRPAAPFAGSDTGTNKVETPGKLLTIIAMLRRPGGATIADLSKATGWKPNSIRGAISGSIRKRRLMNVTSDVVDGARVYRIVS